MSYRTRNPKTSDQAWKEINKALDELNMAHTRIKKAQRFLLNHGNTPGKSSASYHYAIAIRETNRDFSNIRIKMHDALQQFRATGEEG